VPIVIVWFGLTEVGKWFLVFWGVFFTVWMASHLGVQRVNETLLRAALSLGTRPKDLLLAVVLPSSLPMIFVGIRTAIGISFYTLVAAELAGAAFGIAYRLEVTQQNMQVASMMAGLVMLGLISFAADQGFGALSRRLVRWKET
jgi:ABC-type nitrate/sulfonate/bicarbonate transport system permease component